MNLTLHLTERCNMRCTYCTREQQPRTMPDAVLDAACDLAFSSGSRAGLCFFGGEPLLHKELITRAIARCTRLSAETGKPVCYKMTTNGTLLDDAFLAQAKAANIGIGLSFEGLAQDVCRRFPDGTGSFAVVERNAKALLAAMPRSVAMMTIAPQAVPQYAESVRYLYGLGFRHINATIAYGKNVRWTDADLALLSAQLRETAEFWKQCYINSIPFYFSPLDSKVREVIAGYNPAHRCHLGMRQMPVTPAGEIYACTQFIGDPAFRLGDVFTGVDSSACARVAGCEAVPAVCRGCALRKRCTCACGCLNRLETGCETQISPLQCSYERMVIAQADETAGELFAADPERFRQHFGHM